MNRYAPRLADLPPPPVGRTGWPWTEETPLSLFASAPEYGWPKISIVCPSYQQGRYIEETIRSVLLQNYPATEFIVVDGGSSDETTALLETYSPWIHHWQSGPDRGQSHALNKGFTIASGQVFGWINSDDYYLPGAFAAIGRAAGSSQAAMWFGDTAERDDEAPDLSPVRGQPVFAFQVAVGGRTLPSHATFWRREVHQPLNESLRFIMDADLFKRMCASGTRPVHLAVAMAVARRHPAAKTSTIADVARAETEAWGRSQPWHTRWRWLASRVIDRIRRMP